jgi:hypothetical protein
MHLDFDLRMKSPGAKVSAGAGWMTSGAFGLRIAAFSRDTLCCPFVLIPSNV